MESMPYVSNTPGTVQGPHAPSSAQGQDSQPCRDGHEQMDGNSELREMCWTWTESRWVLSTLSLLRGCWRLVLNIGKFCPSGSEENPKDLTAWRWHRAPAATSLITPTSFIALAIEMLFADSLQALKVSPKGDRASEHSPIVGHPSLRTTPGAFQRNWLPKGKPTQDKHFRCGKREEPSIPKGESSWLCVKPTSLKHHNSAIRKVFKSVLCVWGCKDRVVNGGRLGQISSHWAEHSKF